MNKPNTKSPFIQTLLMTSLMHAYIHPPKQPSLTLLLSHPHIPPFLYLAVLAHPSLKEGVAGDHIQMQISANWTSPAGQHQIELIQREGSKKYS